LSDAEDLSGRWTGVYFYPVDPEWNPDDDMPPTPFTADLEDVGGRVTGTTLEPDVLGPSGSPPIPATIEGERIGLRLDFTKFPDGGGQTHSIDYHGDISVDGHVISGTWVIHGEWSGAFQMQRRVATVETKAVAETSA